MKNILSGIMPLLAAIFVTCGASAAVYRQPLDWGWRFQQARNVTAWHDATVPGTVHTDLLANGMIRDPFVGQNEREVQWVDKEDWIYETTFDLAPEVIGSDDISLVFDGLDTYADVYLNDSLLLEADNMFRQWRIPVGRLVRPQGNRLTVYFNSPIRVDLPKFESLPYRHEAGNDQSENGGIFDKRVSVFARKAGYHYGWDWGPRLVTSGIWRPVYLEACDGIKLDDVFVRTVAISREKASMVAEVAVYSDTVVPVADIALNVDGGKKPMVSKRVSLKGGLNTFTLPFTLRHPRLWWCNGLGKPDRYDFTVTVADGGRVDSKTVRTGVRTVEVVREDDADGRSFYFRLNGVPVFAKGANYIPCDNFLPRVTTDVYRRTVKDAADANMNMLRVWGGGVYEDDRFYDLCDSLGIMVWQDFMFACSTYPAEGAMLDNIRAEAEYNVKRLRNHPSIALWCGNNECLEAWYNWGWRRRYTQQGYADVLWNQYVNLFHRLLPDVVARYAPGSFYWPSSPFSRPDGSPEPNMGDSHMWTVWGGGQPIELYNETCSRFFSEYGFQSFPELETVLSYAPDTASHHIDSDVMLAHQRAGANANRKIEDYLLESYCKPKDFPSFLYMSQVLQGDAIKLAMESHRRNKPYCMGSLFWQHNDCWPVASWSSRDYYGRWKAQHYFARKAYRDVLVSVTGEADSIGVHIVSDRTKALDGVLTIEAISLDGVTVGAMKRNVKVAAGESKHVRVPAASIYAGEAHDGIVVSVTFKTGTDVYDNIFFPMSQKEMKYRKPAVNVEIEPVADGEYRLALSADTFTRALRLSLSGDPDCLFSDNYFDLLPGRVYTVTLKSGVSPDMLRSSLRLTNLYDATH